MHPARTCDPPGRRLYRTRRRIAIATDCIRPQFPRERGPFLRSTVKTCPWPSRTDRRIGDTKPLPGAFPCVLGLLCVTAGNPADASGQTRATGVAVRFYNKRSTAERWIKEGKQAVKMTRLSCHRFRSNEVRL